MSIYGFDKFNVQSLLLLSSLSPLSKTRCFLVAKILLSSEMEIVFNQQFTRLRFISLTASLPQAERLGPLTYN